METSFSVIIVSHKARLDEEKLEKLVNGRFTWTDFFSKAPKVAVVKLNSGIKLMDVCKIRIPDCSIYPKENDKSTIILKTEETSSSDLLKKIKKNGAKYPQIEYLANIDNDKNKCQAWNVFVKGGDIPKFLEMQKSIPTIQSAITFKEAKKRFPIKKTPPIVVVKKNKITIPKEIQKRIKITDQNDGTLKLKIKGYKDYQVLFGKSKKPIVSLGVPFNIFYSKSNMKVMAFKTGAKLDKFVEDNSFYGIDDVSVASETSSESDDDDISYALDIYSSLLDDMGICGKLKEYLMKIARNNKDITDEVDEEYVKDILSSIEPDGYDIIEATTEEYDGDWEAACDDFYDRMIKQ